MCGNISKKIVLNFSLEMKSHIALAFLSAIAEDHLELQSLNLYFWNAGISGVYCHWFYLVLGLNQGFLRAMQGLYQPNYSPSPTEKS